MPNVPIETSNKSPSHWMWTIEHFDMVKVKNFFQTRNSRSHVKKCLLSSIVYLLLIAIWIAVDNHQEMKIESDEQYNEETDTFFISFTRDCTSDHFIQWSSALVSLLVIPMFISILLVIAMGNMKKKASESEKLTILALINIVAISLIVLFAVLLANSFVVRKIIISLACLVISMANSITLCISAKY